MKINCNAIWCHLHCLLTLLRMISGARYSGVPHKVHVLPLTRLANPKSVTLNRIHTRCSWHLQMYFVISLQLPNMVWIQHLLIYGCFQFVGLLYSNREGRRKLNTKCSSKLTCSKLKNSSLSVIMWTGISSQLVVSVEHFAEQLVFGQVALNSHYKVVYNKTCNIY